MSAYLKRFRYIVAIAGYLIPEAAVSAHLALAEHHGADLNFEESLIKWEAVTCNGQNIIKVTTDKDIYWSKKIILSVGPWAPAVYGADIPLPLVAERRVLYWFEVCTLVFKLYGLYLLLYPR